MQKDLMTTNIKNRIPGSNPMIDVEKDLLNKGEYGLNSWFIIGHFTDKGHTMSFLFHFMIMKMPIIGNKFLSVVSVTDHTTGYYYGEDKMYSAKEVKLGEKNFSIEMPNGYMKGTWDKMEFGFTMQNWKLSGVGTCLGYPIYSKRTGAFSLLDMYVHQYSIPHMKSKGVLTDGKNAYNFDDDCWFDRQWQNQNMKNVLRWSWIAAYLDNGEVYSIFDCDVPGYQQHWVTISRNDGSLDYEEIEPLENGMNAYWKSPLSKQCYPTSITCRVPKEDAVLVFEPKPFNQEIVSIMKQLHKYEASYDIEGTLKGKLVKGHACIELIGTWKENI